MIGRFGEKLLALVHAAAGHLVAVPALEGVGLAAGGAGPVLGLLVPHGLQVLLGGGGGVSAGAGPHEGVDIALPDLVSLERLLRMSVFGRMEKPRALVVYVVHGGLYEVKESVIVRLRHVALVSHAGHLPGGFLGFRT